MSAKMVFATAALCAFVGGHAIALERSKTKVALSGRFRQAANFDFILVASRSREVVSGLHAHKRLGAYAERLLEADRHIRRQGGVTIENIAQVLARNVEMCGERLTGNAGRLDDLGVGHGPG